MMDIGYSLHLIDLLAKLYRKQLAKVKVAGTLSEWFHVKKGVRQGGVLADIVMKETIDGLQSGLLAYYGHTIRKQVRLSSGTDEYIHTCRTYVHTPRELDIGM